MTTAHHKLRRQYNPLCAIALHAVVNFMNYGGWEWGRIAAGGTMVMLPVLVFSIVVRKFLIQGMTAGAVKG